jgi:hypothetical protein
MKINTTKHLKIKASNELRLLALCFGLVQTVREAFPSLLHIMKEARKRKMQIVPSTP